MQVVLFGNPNVGKTTVYNFLTGQRERTGNWHGVTVEAKSARKGEMIVTDVPGLYSLSCTSPEEISSLREIQRAEKLVQVMDASTLERSLQLTQELARQGKGVLIILTMEREFARRGGFLSAKGLSELLSVPVFSYTGKRSERKELLSFLERDPHIPKTFSLPNSVYSVGEWKENRAERLLYRPVFSVSLFCLLTLLTFFLTFSSHSLGSFGKGLIERFFSFLRGQVEELSLPSVLKLFFAESLTSLGSILGFLPQIFLLNAFLVFMEESGYLSILSFVTDDYLRYLGLTGRSVFSLLSGFGCTAVATSTVKTCEIRERKHVLHLLPYFSCSAKMPVYLTLFSSFFRHPFLPVTILYFFGILIGILTADFCPCKSLPSEVAHFCIPNAKNALKSLFFSCKSFIMKAGTVVLAFLLVSWFFSSYSFQMEYAPERSMLSELCKRISFLLRPMGIDDWRYVYALLSGMVAKENVAGILTMYFPNGLDISLPSALSFAVCILTTSPCISAVVTNASVSGKRRAAFESAMQSLIGLGLGYLTYFLLNHPLSAIPVAIGVCLEKIYRKRNAKLKKLHG
ncbi:MAG: ferrous iron transporter B [Clostridia bacterium]|nr:ferrous iron transporter B [Clostridia bacterium]